MSQFTEQEPHSCLFSEASVMKIKSFITLAPGVNFISFLYYSLVALLQNKQESLAMASFVRLFRALVAIS
jgi:hypothetical protein